MSVGRISVGRISAAQRRVIRHAAAQYARPRRRGGFAIAPYMALLALAGCKSGGTPPPPATPAVPSMDAGRWAFQASPGMEIPVTDRA